MNREKTALLRRPGRVSVVVLVLLLIAAAGGTLLIPSVREAVFRTETVKSQDSGAYILHPVGKAPFKIEISEDGKVDSVRSATLSSNVKGTTAIISIVPEGTIVGPPTVAGFDGFVELTDISSSTAQVRLVQPEADSKDYEITLGKWSRVLVGHGQKVRKGDFLVGDVVCELDSSSLVDLEVAQQIRVTNVRAALETAETNLKIQETTNEKLLAAAELAEKLAQLDFDSYTADGGEFEQAEETILGDIKQNEEELAIAQEQYERKRELARKGYTSLYDLEAARVQVTQKRILLNVKQGELEVLRNFTQERTEEELQQLAEDTKRDTRNAQLENEAAMAQRRADLEAAVLTLKVEEETLDRLQRQIAECRLVAPQAGEVVYSKPDNRSGDPIVIEAGTQVRERQEIVKLPDLSEMKVKTRIHESRIRQVKVGQQVEIHVSSLPDLQFHGTVETLATLPVPGAWPNRDQMEYESSITITDDESMTSQLKPGMGAEIRIIVEERDESVVQIPVQAVLPIAGQYFTYVLGDAGPQRRSLSVGLSNDTFTEINDGVAIGENVILNPRTHFSNEINQLEQDLSKNADEGNRPPNGRGRMPSGFPAGG